MHDGYITIQKKEYVAVLTIHKPVTKLTEMVILSDHLSEICNKIISDDEIRIVVIASISDNLFSMGEKLIDDIYSHKEAFPQGLPQIAKPIARLEVPVIVALQGDVIGQGLELALACDLRFSAETSRFGLPHARVGAIPWDGGTQRLSRIVGRGKAMEMILAGENIDAHEAFRIGLVNRVVSSEILSEQALDMANEIASKAPVALRYAKEAVNYGLDMTLDQGLRLEADLYFLLHTTTDRTEGIRAFQEKRVPKFKGE